MIKGKYIISYTIEILTYDNKKKTIKHSFISDGSVIENYLNSPLKDEMLIIDDIIIKTNEIKNYKVKDYKKVVFEGAK